MTHNAAAFEALLWCSRDLNLLHNPMAANTDNVNPVQLLQVSEGVHSRLS
jgi:hypothetical protein